ncbi:SH2 domain-containing adapter protein F-like isoform X1 [Synchiropus splendidus]|uniref:SH2 domain-containing adapter protein F-like isoform X1 n=1 Tax=Synchiropus splendidus TaxID=270530 RepID=UPI00237EB457|nr:SH2 domain-containing adapter protein F-like isoform X1 [Synchiropus splendidus]
MAKWLKDYLNFGTKRDPPQPPRPDYSESEILRAYRAQKELDFEDPYQCCDKDLPNGTFTPCSTTLSLPSFPAFGSLLRNSPEQVKVVSPKHRLIKVDSQEFGHSKTQLSPVTIHEEPVVPSAPVASDADTDYSDPFDARPVPRVKSTREPKSSPTDYCSYMEPFEAQRIISEMHHRSGRSGSGDAGQLYDNPYEEKTRGTRRAAPASHVPQWADGGLSLVDSRESRLPQNDERPADEYDQPWEWKKDNISKALAVQFEGAERERSRVQTEQIRLAKTGGPMFSADSTTLRLVGDALPVLGERVDPYLPLESQVWYHGALSRAEAETLLTLCKESSYLVRKSQTSQNDFSLSLRSCKGFMHMKFTQCADGRFVLGENSPPFSTIPEVIHYYTTHKLPIRGAEHMSLLYPVIVQTL